MLRNKTKTKITDLDLQRCCLTPESISVLAKTIQSNIKLKTINLTHNGICDESALKLLQAVKLNQNVIKLKLDMNPAALTMINEIEFITS